MIRKGKKAKAGTPVPVGAGKKSVPARARKKKMAAGSPAHIEPVGYEAFLAQAKAWIARAQARAAMAVYREQLELYWNLGRGLVGREGPEDWSTEVVARLGRDLASAFPGVRGFSRTNLFRMRLFFLAYPPVPQAVGLAKIPVPQAVGLAETPVPQAVGLDILPLPEGIAELPWGRHILLLEKLDDPAERAWYASAARHHGWSRAVLETQIESRARERWGKAQTNFPSVLPPAQSDLAREALKDPYNFEFLTLAADAHERALELGLLAHLQKFLLELGAGFAFVGQQYHLEVEGDDFYLDLLFYHLRLRCFVVIELKRTEFRPEYAGKLNFYLSVVDDRLRNPNDQPSIGIILCKSKKGAVVEYALRDMAKPMGVSTYRVTHLPAELAESLPTVEQLEHALDEARDADE